MKIYHIAKKVEKSDIPTYCSWCKKHISGPEYGFLNENAPEGTPAVSHGICKECYKQFDV